MLIDPLKVFFKACMWGLMPARKAGAFGTPEDPIYFEAGDAVPWYVEARWPLSLNLHFCCDAETYWDGENQVARPLWRRADPLMRADAPMFWNHVLIVGAPTEINGLPRPRRPKLAMRDVEDAVLVR